MYFVLAEINVSDEQLTEITSSSWDDYFSNLGRVFFASSHQSPCYIDKPQVVRIVCENEVWREARPEEIYEAYNALLKGKNEPNFDESVEVGP